MAFYDDKRFILSHIRHSFITCDDTGMCENVMLSEKPNRYPYESIYHHPFDYNSDDENDFGYGLNSVNSRRDYDGDAEDGDENDDDADTLSNVSIDNSFRFSEDDINFFKLTELEFKSELVEENPLQSFDIMSDSYDMGIRRRSNTAVRLEKLKKERKFQAKTKVVNWKSPTKIVSIKVDGSFSRVRRVVLNPSALSAQEIALLEYDEKENQYYETDEYRKILFPKAGSDSDELNEAADNADKQLEQIGFYPSKTKGRRKSALTLQIEKSPTIPINPFNQYTRFDGTVSEGNAPTKRVRIFFKIHEDDQEFQFSDFTKKVMPSGVTCGTNWIEIVVLANAKVNELIGLICWNYTHLQIGPPLKTDISMYALKIAEETGEVDTDFPSLTGSDDIKRYGFPYLALHEVEKQIVVTIFFESEDVFSQINVESPQITLQEIVDQIKKKRYQLFRDKYSISDSDNLWLELRSQPGVVLDLKSPISQYIHSGANVYMVDFTLKFSTPILPTTLATTSYSAKSAGDESNHLGDNITENLNNSSNNLLKANKSSDNTIISNVRSYTALSSLDDDLGPSSPFTLTNRQSSSSSKNSKKGRKDWSTSMIEIMKAPLYQCFEVTVVNKFYNTPIEMGISGTKVEITPKTAHSKSGSPNFTDRFFSRFQQIKAMNIDVEDVVDCTNATSSKSVSSRQYFKLVYFNGSDFKTIKFEGDPATVDDIVFKLRNVMKMRTSLRRTEYQAVKQRKKSLSSKVYFRSNFKISSGSSSSDDDSYDMGTSGSGGSSVGTTDNDNNDSGKTGNQLNNHFFAKRENKFRRFSSKHND